MATYFKFPDVGEGITEGELLKWLVKEGDAVAVDQNLAEIETAKAVVQIPSPKQGTILKLYYQEGDTVKVGTNLVAIGEKGEAVEEEPQQATTKQETTKPQQQGTQRVKATPRTRKLALELDIDLSQVQGSGPGGRITDDDVKNHKSEKPEAKTCTIPQTDFSKLGKIRKEKLNQAAKAMRDHMVLAKSTIPHAWIMDEVDVTALVETRQKKKAEAEKQGIKLTYLPLIAKAVVNALKNHPYLNSSYSDATEEIIFKEYYNLGIAVDSENGLIVPVIKNVEEKDIFTIAKEMQTLAEKARIKKIELKELQGSTFTITNVGALGTTLSVPVINPPDVAILAIHKIKEKPVANKGKVEIKKILSLSLAFDHRIVDGGKATRFLNEVIKNIEEAKFD